MGVKRVLILRIRQAETALKDGRLDEAFELARPEDVRAHRRGQRLIGRLVRSLVTRGEAHLEDGRLQEAATDCERARQLGGNLPEVVALRDAVGQAVSARERSGRRRADAAATARQHVENGRLSFGANLLADMPTDSHRAQALRGELGARRNAADAALHRAEAAVAREDWAAAMDELAEAKRAHAASNRVQELSARVVTLVNQHARSAIEQGRLDLADLLIGRLVSFSGQTIETRELHQVIEQCRQVRERIEQGHPRQAVEVLQRLASILPQAGWVQDALASAQQSADGLERLRGGPLGMLNAGRPDIRTATPSDETVPFEAPVPRPASVNQSAETGMPSRFMIHVDGVGSYLVLRDRQITIGPDGSSNRPELALLSEPGTPPATVERVDDDYFLTSTGTVRVGERAARRKLLSDGDKIALSRRCRIRFGLPHPASTSAVLDLSGTRLPRTDARRVILLDRDLVIGPGPASHIRADELTSPAVLSVRDGRVFCNSRDAIEVADRPMDRLAEIPLDAHVRIGPVSFVMTTT